MKKNMVIGMILAIMLVFGTSTVFAAGEDTVKTFNKDEAFAQFLSNWDAKFNERTSVINEKFNTMLQRVTKRNTRTLEIVSIWHPDMQEQFETISDEHITLHNSIFDLKTLMRNTFHEQSVAELTQLHAELMVSVQEGTMTYREVLAQMKSFREQRVSLYKEMIEAYKAIIEPALENNVLLKEQLKENLTALKSAIDANEEEEAKLAISNIYDLLLEHNLFDAYKLTVLESLEN
ncbi:MAG: hypothetical protein JXQ23_10295 [Clostridia bacterium]|nr:hypothetical protein [Clostridia bacterium]